MSICGQFWDSVTPALENGTGCRTTVMATPLILTSGPVKCEAMLHGCGTNLVCLFFAIATRCDGCVMRHEMRRKPKPIPSWIFKRPHHIGMVREEVAIDNAVSYIQQGNGLQQR